MALCRRAGKRWALSQARVSEATEDDVGKRMPRVQGEPGCDAAREAHASAQPWADDGMGHAGVAERA